MGVKNVKQWTKKELVERLVLVLCVFGTIGIALKFSTFWDHWVYFPMWPNICDSMFLIFAILCTTWLAIRNGTKMTPEKTSVHIRGLRQLKALFIFIEQMWLVLFGRDTRGLEEWEKEHVIYSGIEFMRDRLRCAVRELEIFFGFAKPYALFTTPLFNKQYSEWFGDAALIDFLYKQDLQNEKIRNRQ